MMFLSLGLTYGRGTMWERPIDNSMRRSCDGHHPETKIWWNLMGHAWLGMSARPWVPALLGPLVAVVIGACGMLPWVVGPSIPRADGGRSTSNGERIYFTAVSDRTGRIDYRGGPPGGGMMTGAWGLACVSCHGAEGRGGVHVMHMLLMDAPDIRWSTLASEMSGGHNKEPESGEGGLMAGYDLDAFRRAVVEGQHPDGTALSLNMPRWNLGEQDLADLAEFLRSLP